MLCKGINLYKAWKCTNGILQRRVFNAALQGNFQLIRSVNTIFKFCRFLYYVPCYPAKSEILRIKWGTVTIYLDIINHPIHSFDFSKYMCNFIILPIVYHMSYQKQNIWTLKNWNTKCMTKITLTKQVSHVWLAIEHHKSVRIW